MVTKKLPTRPVKKEDWMQTQWRPLMAMMYLSVCTFDFIIAPVLWSVLQALDKGNISSQWSPITLQGAGLFHLAMGGILGIAAYGRTQEKINGTATNPMNTTTSTTSSYTPSSYTPSTLASTPYTPSAATTPWTSNTTTSTTTTPLPDAMPDPDPTPVDAAPVRARRQR